MNITKKIKEHVCTQNFITRTPHFKHSRSEYFSHAKLIWHNGLTKGYWEKTNSLWLIAVWRDMKFHNILSKILCLLNYIICRFINLKGAIIALKPSKGIDIYILFDAYYHLFSSAVCLNYVIKLLVLWYKVFLRLSSEFALVIIGINLLTSIICLQ